MKKVKLTFIVKEEPLIKGAQYELEHGNYTYAVGMLEEGCIESAYEIEELPNK